MHCEVSNDEGDRLLDGSGARYHFERHLLGEQLHDPELG